MVVHVRSTLVPSFSVACLQTYPISFASIDVYTQATIPAGLDEDVWNLILENMIQNGDFLCIA